MNLREYYEYLQALPEQLKTEMTDKLIDRKQATESRQASKKILKKKLYTTKKR